MPFLSGLQHKINRKIVLNYIGTKVLSCMNPSDLKDFLDEKVLQYNTLDFIESDPVQIPHLFTQKEDVEIAGFLSATIAW